MERKLDGLIDSLRLVASPPPIHFIDLDVKKLDRQIIDLLLAVVLATDNLAIGDVLAVRAHSRKGHAGVVDPLLDDQMIGGGLFAGFGLADARRRLVLESPFQIVNLDHARVLEVKGFSLDALQT